MEVEKRLGRPEFEIGIEIVVGSSSMAFEKGNLIKITSLDNGKVIFLKFNRLRFLNKFREFFKTEDDFLEQFRNLGMFNKHGVYSSIFSGYYACINGNPDFQKSQLKEIKEILGGRVKVGVLESLLDIELTIDRPAYYDTSDKRIYFIKIYSYDNEPALFLNFKSEEDLVKFGHEYFSDSSQFLDMFKKGWLKVKESDSVISIRVGNCNIYLNGNKKEHPSQLKVIREVIERTNVVSAYSCGDNIPVNCQTNRGELDRRWYNQHCGEGRKL